MIEQVGTLHNGGWDDYIVDTDDIIDDPGNGIDFLIYPEELKVAGDCGDPHYLRTKFSSALRTPFPG